MTSKVSSYQEAKSCLIQPESRIYDDTRSLMTRVLRKLEIESQGAARSLSWVSQLIRVAL